MPKGIAKGWSGNAHGNATGPGQYQNSSKVGNVANQLRRSLNRGIPGRINRAIVLALTGAAVGAASRTHSFSRISAGTTTGQAGQSAGELGGMRTIETISRNSGVTTADDLTTLDGNIAKKSRPPTYAKDKSGNGGGGQLGKL